jgi:hypothetical protein
VDIDALRASLIAFPDTLLVEADGDLFAIYDPDGTYEQQPRQGWATVVTSNADHSASILDQPGMYRLNIGLPRDRFRELFDSAAEHHPTTVDVLQPHPIYGGQNWVCVLNPDRTWPIARQLLADAHAFAVRKYDNAARRGNLMPPDRRAVSGSGRESNPSDRDTRPHR